MPFLHILLYLWLLGTNSLEQCRLNFGNHLGLFFIVPQTANNSIPINLNHFLEYVVQMVMPHWLQKLSTDRYASMLKYR